jgi:two-component system nitrogen regulation response regulator GlnG
VSSILIIDDEDKYFDLCTRFMPEHRFLPVARNYREAASVLDQRGVDLVLLDVHFDIPEEDLLPYDKGDLLARLDRDRVVERLRRAQGLHILDRLRQSHPDLPVIVMTSRDDLPLEADAERLRAEDYTYLLDDDYLDARSLKLQMEGILARSERPASSPEEPFYWGGSPAMLNLRRRLAILARGSLPIILLGATGTGKSLLAREFIHPRSQRTGPFVAVDLSTIPHELMAAHLFGVIKGAYTGATASREGVLARAHGGTLFLDEIGNLSLELQKSLLLVLQEGRFSPVGSVEERVVDIKLVVATNENLGAMVRDGRFREDLYMRLNPATAMTLPSLRERAEDIGELLEVFVRRVAREPYNRDLVAQYAAQRGLKPPEDGSPMPITVGKGVPAKLDSRRIHLLFHPSSIKQLRDFEWPGNFRQFEMVLSNLVTLTLVELVDRAEQVEPEDPGKASRPDVIPILPRTVRELLRPMEVPRGAEAPTGPVESDGGMRITVDVRPQESLNAVSCAVERHYLEQLYEKYGGELGRMAEVLLGDAGAGRKVQLRMNQLGIKLRKLKRRRIR